MSRAHYKFWEAVEVRWSDMDAMGHVNNARYFTYLESARIHFFETLGLNLRGENQQGVALVSVACNFRRQVRYPNTVQIGTRVTGIGTSSFHLEHVFYLEDGDEIMADAKSVVVTVDYNADKAVPLSPGLRDRLERAMEPVLPE
jgi:acyl-CoA thioester hydrolase